MSTEPTKPDSIGQTENKEPTILNPPTIKESTDKIPLDMQIDRVVKGIEMPEGYYLQSVRTPEQYKKVNDDGLSHDFRTSVVETDGMNSTLTGAKFDEVKISTQEIAIQDAKGINIGVVTAAVIPEWMVKKHMTFVKMQPNGQVERMNGAGLVNDSKVNFMIVPAWIQLDKGHRHKGLSGNILEIQKSVIGTIAQNAPPDKNVYIELEPQGGLTPEEMMEVMSGDIKESTLAKLGKTRAESSFSEVIAQQLGLTKVENTAALPHSGPVYIKKAEK